MRQLRGGASWASVNFAGLSPADLADKNHGNYVELMKTVSWLAYTMLQDVGRRLRAAAYLQLAIEVRDMALHGVDGDPQTIGDSLVALSLGDKRQDLRLSSS